MDDRDVAWDIAEEELITIDTKEDAKTSNPTSQRPPNDRDALGQTGENAPSTASKTDRPLQLNRFDTNSDARRSRSSATSFYSSRLKDDPESCLSRSNRSDDNFNVHPSQSSRPEDGPDARQSRSKVSHPRSEPSVTKATETNDEAIAPHSKATPTCDPQRPQNPSVQQGVPPVTSSTEEASNPTVPKSSQEASENTKTAGASSAAQPRAECTPTPMQPSQDTLEMAPRRGSIPRSAPVTAAASEFAAAAPLTSHKASTPRSPAKSRRSASTKPVPTASLPMLKRECTAGPLQEVIVVSEVEGRLSLINKLASKHQCRAVIHTGNFGFYDAHSHNRLPKDDLRRVARRELGVAEAEKLSDDQIKAVVAERCLLSELVDFFEGRKRLEVPVYVVWGRHEDLTVIEKLRKGIYHIPNLYLLDGHNSYSISTSSITLRLFGLGGCYEYENLFNIGQGKSGIVSGAEGRVWANMHQMGELLGLAESLEDPSEVRVFVSQANPAKEPLAHILASFLNAQFSISAGGAMCTVCSVFTDDSVHPAGTLDAWLKAAKTEIKSLWDQLYFASHENFPESLRKSCIKFVTRLDDLVGETQTRSCVNLNICPLRHGEARLTLGSEGVAVNVSFSPSPPKDANAQNSAAEQSQTPALVSSSSPARPEPFASPAAPASVPIRSSAVPLPPSAAPVSASPPPSSDMPRQASQRAKDLSAQLPSSTTKIDNNWHWKRCHDEGLPTLHGEEDCPSSPRSSSAFYVDRAGNSIPRDNSLSITNLPYDMTGESLDKELLSSYDIVRIDFVGFRNCNAIVQFSSTAEMERANAELADRRAFGRTLGVRPASRT